MRCYCGGAPAGVSTWTSSSAMPGGSSARSLARRLSACSRKLLEGLALVLQLRDLTVGGAGRWFFDFLGGGLWFSNIVLQTVGHRGETRRALPCRCQPGVSIDRVFSPPSARARASPALGGLWQLCDWRGRARRCSSKTLSVGDAMGPALGPPSTPTSAADVHALFGCGLGIGSSTSGMVTSVGPSTS